MNTLVKKKEFTLTKSKNGLEKSRSVIEIQNISLFYELLHDRCMGALDRTKAVEGTYMMFINSLSRERYAELNESYRFVYAGTKTQRNFLEASTTHKSSKDILDTWKQLADARIPAGETDVTYQATKNLGMAKIHRGDLKTYFSRSQSKWKDIESKIVKYYLSTEQYNYISLPLMQFTNCDGMIHIIYKGTQKNEDALQNIDIIRQLILSFMNEYEGILLDWDMDIANYRKFSILSEIIAKIKNNSFWEDLEKQEFFRELNLKEYYEKHLPYFTIRIEQANSSHALLYQRYLLQAITQILIDSFAHNISAHALTALSWRFQQRADRRHKLAEKVENVRELLQRYQETRNPDLPKSGQNAKFKQFVHDLVCYPEYADPEGVTLDKSLVRLDYEVHLFLKFLTEKGTFWSGVIRDVTVGAGGSVTNLFDLLWYDFLNNALYLGTIARSEKIERINLHITFFENELPANGSGQPSHRCSKTVRLEGLLGYTDLSDVPEPTPPKTSDKDLPDYMRRRSRFTHPATEKFEALKAELEEVKIYLPGDIIGRHALLTMLENELRNAKHFEGKTLETMRKEGLTLHLSLQRTYVNPAQTAAGEPELWRFGIWIDAESKLYYDQKNAPGKGEPIVHKRFYDLCDDIMEIRHGSQLRPRMGGTSQDKICAALLFNNSFSTVQNGDTGTSRRKEGTDGNPGDQRRDMHYYPWIVPATCPMPANRNAPHADVEYSLHQAQQYMRKSQNPDIYPFLAEKEDVVNDKRFYDPNWRRGFDLKEKKALDAYLNSFAEADRHHTGFLKKYFHLWAGKEVHVDTAEKRSTKQSNHSWDNPARYRFTILNDKALEDTSRRKQELRQQGVVRILEHLPAHTPPDLRITYLHWLRQWLGAAPILLTVTEKEEGGFLGGLIYDPDQPEVLRHLDGSQINPLLKTLSNNTKRQKLPLVHNPGDGSSANLVNYRRHGVLKTYYIGGDYDSDEDIALEQIPPEKQPEFFETLLTQIVTFDNRIHQRLEDGKGAAFYKKYLNVYAFEELKDGEETDPVAAAGRWRSEAQKERIGNCHFLVMHLTFIENIMKAYHGINEEQKFNDVVRFFEEELEPLVQHNGKIRDNFLLIIVTGRGRVEWQNQLKKDNAKKYSTHILFRPIEAILSSLEVALSIGDDLELKHRLTKVLFGS